MTLTLNDSQAKAFDNIVAFLATDDKYIIVDGSGGTGKSFLINYIKVSCFYYNYIQDYLISKTVYFAVAGINWLCYNIKCRGEAE